ncbi:16S rRNA (cytosine(967)-C(5))-methyltransferase RsmB [Levilactobacillus suantsaii]|uniref:16S rRNA (cytosine(967)-C(5))-methyltransferase RsmB n=1 Tax=Levilactobacillus suantsaii TaxID=2292255 RepID=UPI0015F3A35C|nr:16S rRNA (cytosine(967)-C(5))-methyltransferase RsmB [Levilactobacillus suantsaii]QMU07762.1 16S rRNA (cytosine(967)-C(5))-methyltransferase RsmB [Levilactobacillus suantsaii]
MTKDNPRALAVESLTRVANGAYSNLQLDKMIAKSDLNDADRRLLTNLVYGTIQHRLTLDYYLRSFVKPGERLEPWVENTLLIALYQLLYLDRIPKRAIFNEAIQFAKDNGHEGIRRFVTGILHAIDRQGVPDLNQISDPLKRLSVTYSMPTWLVTRLTDQLGAEKTQSILATINQPAAQSVRVNTAVTTKTEAKAELEMAGFTVTESEVSGEGLRIDGQPASRSELFNQGQMTIQDESAMLPVEALQLQPGDQVLDACAAPGGKTTQIAAALDPEKGGQVTALDLHEKKVKLIAKNAARLQVADRVNAMALDARKVDSEFSDATFDKILVDAPCSGIGLIRRKPEIRYDKTPQDSEHLQTIQLAILDAVSRKLKPQGTLVYSTCTILATENDDVVAQFLATHPNFESVRVTTTKNVKADRETATLSIYPDDFDTDGFFVSAFRRKN